MRDVSASGIRPVTRSRGGFVSKSNIPLLGAESAAELFGVENHRRRGLGDVFKVISDNLSPF